MDRFVYTTALEKLRGLDKRIKIVSGGTSAGKTFGILPIEIDYAARHGGTVTSIVSETIPHLRRGAIKDFKAILYATNRWRDGAFNNTLLTYTFANGSYIEFFSCDQPDRLRGARRDRLYINEANTVKWSAYMELAVRTKQSIFLDFNPTAEFWAHTEFKKDPDVDRLTLTYKDNQALAPAIVKEIEKAREKAKTSTWWANWWRVYGLGQLGRLQGTVFDNWEIIPSLPGRAKLLGCGLDFGYTNDPTALIGVYYLDGQRILHELLYHKKMLNHQIARYIPKHARVWADSAEPKSIDEIAAENVQIGPVTKGKDSVQYGIQLMQGQRYRVTAQSVNLIRELRGYCYDKDPSGKPLNRPIDAFNHAIDAVRYHEMMSIGLSRPGFFF